MSGPMGLVYPTPGDTSDTWGVVLNVLLGLVENHDHTTGKGVPIVAAALSIDADVSWGQHAITAMTALGFTEIATSAATSYVDALFVNSSDHNLYFRNASGTNVQITDGSTLDVSIVGGIGGDYSTVGALLSYDDATRRYLLQQEGSPRPWAGLATADIDLYQKAASIANKVTLKSPSSLAASYAVTLPAALPSGTSPMMLNSSGSIVTTRSETMSLSPSSASIRTATTSITWAINGGEIMQTPIIAFASGGSPSANAVASFPINLPLGSVITGYKVWLNKTSNASHTLSSAVIANNAQASPSVSNSANDPNEITLSETGLSITITTGVPYSISVGNTDETTPDEIDSIIACEVTYTTSP